MWWENAPGNKVFDVVVFEGPDVLSEFGLVTVFSAAEWCGVVSISCVINFLDVAFSLNRSTNQPFTKPNTPLQYVHRERNHPPITIKNIPAGINKRLSSLSSDKASFDQAALHTRKHSTKVDTTTHYSTNQPKQANGKTDNAITSSGTTLLLARTPAPTSDTNSLP